MPVMPVPVIDEVRFSITGVFSVVVIVAALAVGTATKMTELLGDDAAPVPTLLVAVTAKVYAVPLVSPLTVMVQAAGPAQEPASPPGLEVAVYVVIAEPPLDAGAVNVMVALVLPATALTDVGAPGSPAGVTLLDALDAEPVPTALVALTVNV
jgi:hypothetical protein